MHRAPCLILATVLTTVAGSCLAAEHADKKIVLHSPTRTSQVSDLIFRTYVVPFEVVSILLLAALVGAVVIARRD